MDCSGQTGVSSISTSSNAEQESEVIISKLESLKIQDCNSQKNGVISNSESSNAKPRYYFSRDGRLMGTFEDIASVMGSRSEAAMYCYAQDNPCYKEDLKKLFKKYYFQKLLQKNIEPFSKWLETVHCPDDNAYGFFELAKYIFDEESQIYDLKTEEYRPGNDIFTSIKKPNESDYSLPNFLKCLNDIVDEEEYKRLMEEIDVNDKDFQKNDGLKTIIEYSKFKNAWEKNYKSKQSELEKLPKSDNTNKENSSTVIDQPGLYFYHDGTFKQSEQEKLAKSVNTSTVCDQLENNAYPTTKVGETDEDEDNAPLNAALNVVDYLYDFYDDNAPFIIGENGEVIEIETDDSNVEDSNVKDSNVEDSNVEDSYGKYGKLSKPIYDWIEDLEKQKYIGRKKFRLGTVGKYTIRISVIPYINRGTSIIASMCLPSENKSETLLTCQPENYNLLAKLGYQDVRRFDTKDELTRHVAKLYGKLVEINRHVEIEKAKTL